MGTKSNPGKFDCYANALPDEPMFILLARDPDFWSLVHQWAERRKRDIHCGVRPQSDMAMVAEAEECAWNGQKWRKENNGIWRPSNAKTESDNSLTDPSTMPLGDRE